MWYNMPTEPSLSINRIIATLLSLCLWDVSDERRWKGDFPRKSSASAAA